MKSFTNSLFAPFAFVFLTAVAALAQAPASKVVVIDTTAFFNEQSGITKIAAANRAVKAEIDPRRIEVETMIRRLDSLEKEIATMQDNAAKGVPIDQNLARTKSDEAETLRRDVKYKGDAYNAWAEKTQRERVQPIYADALRDLGEYIKIKGYGIVFDSSKDRDGFLIFAGDQYDITKEFIAYYNAKPAGATVPKPTGAPAPKPAATPAKKP